MGTTPLTDSRPSLAGMAPDELAGLAEIMALLGVTKRTALKYVNRPEFPEPLDRLATGRVWLRADVQAWAKANLPLKPGRPPKASA